jgi:hypothetical protein
VDLSVCSHTLARRVHCLLQAYFFLSPFAYLRFIK